jgi:hypothetical protein
MLASTMQISTHHQPTTHPTTTAADQAMPGTKDQPQPTRSTTQQVHDPAGRTVVLSEPQQGVHRPHQQPPAPRSTDTPQQGRVPGTNNAGTAGPNSPVSPPTSNPRPDIRGPRGSADPLPGSDRRS